MTPVRWGIIGCGDVTEVKSGPAFARAEGSALVAVMRRTAHLAEDYARRHGVPRWYADAEALARDPDVDAVYVATPPDGHLDGVRLAARHGKPVYVEKPMARTHDECLAMIQVCRQAGVPLFTAYYRRMLPRFLKVKELVDGDRIGQVRSVSVRLCRLHVPMRGALPWRFDPQISGGGLFVDLASHTLDLLDYILGPIEEAVGGAANQGGFYRAEDIVTASLTFASGVRGTGLWCFTADRNEDVVEIVGSEGRVTCSTFDEAPVLLEHGGETEEFVIPHPQHVQQPLIQSIVDQLHGCGRCVSTGESGARTNQVMDALLAGYRRTKA
jgi:1,5-anhydro-D-fructose reductase (1,5-anhydro-D-mannitol-forming)